MTFAICQKRKCTVSPLVYGITHILSVFCRETLQLSLRRNWGTRSTPRTVRESLLRASSCLLWHAYQYMFTVFTIRRNQRVTRHCRMTRTLFHLINYNCNPLIFHHINETKNVISIFCLCLLLVLTCISFVSLLFVITF